MTSAINYTAIATGFPIAGQDNDSQGFRSNFGAISAALSTAKDEITNLQSKVVLKSSLTAVETATNDLNGSTIADGILNGMGTKALAGIDVAGTFVINLSLAGFYYCTLTGDKAISIQGFPSWATASVPAYCSVKVMMKAGSGLASNPIATIGTIGGHSVTFDTASTSGAWASGSTNITLNRTTNKWKLIEAFSYDGGLTIFVRFLGEY